MKHLIKMLKKKSELFGFKVWAFCFMPDHLHLLIEGKFPGSDLKKFVSSYKQSTGYHYKKYVAQSRSAGLQSCQNKASPAAQKNYVAQGFSPAPKPAAQDRSAGLQSCQALWQPSYYDHILRKDEAITDIAQYIFDNPVRKGLVKHYPDYEHKGSFELDLKHFF